MGKAILKCLEVPGYHHPVMGLLGLPQRLKDSEFGGLLNTLLESSASIR